MAKFLASISFYSELKSISVLKRTPSYTFELKLIRSYDLSFDLIMSATHMRVTTVKKIEKINRVLNMPPRRDD